AVESHRDPGPLGHLLAEPLHGFPAFGSRSVPGADGAIELHLRPGQQLDKPLDSPPVLAARPTLRRTLTPAKDSARSSPCDARIEEIGAERFGMGRRTP